ncbi:MAG TPA: UDP-N-acetylglucosamine 2-epimerase [Bacteroidia bacterium]|nr:UDP-N-acetylglucosamine 2-epimerase [Bacteroidia bacterium]
MFKNVRLQTDYFIIHTGQHYSFEMDRVFSDQLFLPEPDYKLDVGSDTAQTGKIMMRVKEVLRKSKPDFVLVALAATKLHIKVGHVEA